MSLVYCACGHVEDNDQHACPVTQKRLRQQLSLAEEGLANYAQELANARHDIERLTAACSAEATEVERLKVHMRNVAGWLNNGCEPAKGAAELLLIAGLPPTPLG